MKTLANLVALSLLAAGCGEDKPKQATAPIVEAATFANLLAAQRPIGAEGVVKLRAAAPAVDTEVTVTGRIAGSKKPINDFASLTLADSSILYCGETDQCGCSTPWDLCCENGLAPKLCTIEVKDASGKLVRSSLRGLGGLKEISTLTVRGKVSSSSPEILIIEASQIFVDKP